MNLKELRKLLHENAEMSGQEFKTKQILKDVLCEHHGSMIEGHDGCSLYVFYDYKKEKTVMVRAEMDGLLAGNQVRHVCGHDGHMSMVCGVSEYLNSQNDFPVNVLLVFQSSEETGSGALNVLNDPAFLRICPDEAVALHCFPMDETGFYVRKGMMCASGKEVNVTFKGESGHCALQLKETALKKCTDFLYDLQRKEFHDGFISMNVVQCGSSCNQVSEYAYAKGTIRALSRSSEKQMLDWLRQLDGTFEFSSGYPVLRNSSVLVERAVLCGAQLLNEPLWICDDFACFAECLPSVYILMGMKVQFPLHHADFEFDDEMLEKGVEFIVKMLKNL